MKKGCYKSLKRKNAKGNFGSKVLSAATLAGLMLFGANAANADEPTPIENLNISQDNGIYYGQIKDITSSSAYDTIGNVTINNNTIKSSNGGIRGSLYQSMPGKDHLTGTINGISGNYVEAGQSVYGGLINGGSSDSKGYIEINGAITNNIIKALKRDENGNITGDGMNWLYGGVFECVSSKSGGITEISNNSTEAYDSLWGGVTRYSELGTVGNIEDNKAVSYNSSVYGGVIYSSTVEKINGAIKNNSVVALKYDENGNVIGGGHAQGGALVYSTIKSGNVTEISGNSVEGWNDVYGAALSSISGSIDTIGDIKNNRAISYNGTAEGGAIMGGVLIGEINGVIKDNYVRSLKYDESGKIIGGGNAYGGALQWVNVAGGNVTEMSGNYAEGWSSAYGGVMQGNGSGTKFDTVGDIINNHTIAYSSSAYGSYGGALYSVTLGEVTGVIKNNYATSIHYNDNGIVDGGSYASGGAFYSVNILDGSVAEISDNYAEGFQSVYGGVAYNGRFNKIGDIKNNHAISYASEASGGAFNSVAISEINGVITGNYTESLNYDENGNIVGGGIARGGAMSWGSVSGGSIKEISNNYAKGWGETTGGAINGTPLCDVGDIKNNYVISYNNNALGGAINNSIIASNLDKRYDYTIWTYKAKKSDGTTITYWYTSEKTNIENALAQGKKLTLHEFIQTPTYNDSQWANLMQNIANGTYVTEDPRITLNITDDDMWIPEGGITNINIIGNYAEAHGEGAIAQGGAIYQTSDLNIIADGSLEKNNGNVLIKDNYVQVNNGEKDYQSIYMESNTTLNLEQMNGGKFYLYDNINGTEGYNVNIKGDSTGTMYLYNDIKNANVLADNTTIETTDGVIHDYVMKTLTSNDNTSWKFDVKLDGTTVVADTITTTDDTANGTVTIKGLNFISDSLGDFIDRQLKVQILKNTEGNNNLKLALDAEYADGSEKVISETSTTEIVGLTKDVSWNDNFNELKHTTTVLGKLKLDTTSTTDDSLGVLVTSVNTTTDLGTVDTLKAINNLDTTEDRTFSASSSDDTYTVKEDIGTTANGILTVQGVADDTARSTVDFDEHKGFELNNNDTTLTLKNVEITGANGLVSGSATDNVKVILDNVVLDGTNNGVSTSGDIDIKGNSTISDNINALGANSKINIDGIDEVTLDSTISGSDTSTLNIHDGTIDLTDNAKVLVPHVTANDTVLNLAENSKLSGLNLTFNGNNVVNIKNEDSLNRLNPTFNDTTSLNIANASIGTLAFGDVKLNGLVKMNVDADLASQKMDTISAATATVNGGSINVEKINLLSPTTEPCLKLLFTENKDLAGAVSYSGSEELAYSPIYLYDVSYDKIGDAGYFSFARHGIGSKNASDGFNPAVLSSPVATQASAQTTMNYGFNYAFEHAYSFTTLPEHVRIGKIKGDEIALSTDFNNNIDLNKELDLDHTNKAIWVKPYTSFEKLNLHDGPKVDMISYGTIIGGDSEFRKLRNGWTNVGTLYIGYNGSSIDYNDVDMTTNGGMLGVTETFYKNNFFTAITAQAGAGFAQANTMYGKDEMTSIMGGIASKTGYNFEFKEGKFVIQPNLMLNYSMVKTLDYTNAAGVRINSDPLHTIQINPTIRFIANLNHGWQPYFNVGMVWNVMNNSHVTANGVKLPNTYTKPYVEYGVGVQKHIGEKFSGYAQAMVRNGGRNGVALTAGFRWALGSKDNKKVEKSVMKDNKIIDKKDNKIVANVNGSLPENSEVNHKKTIIKSLNSQKSRNIARYMAMIEE